MGQPHESHANLVGLRLGILSEIAPGLEGLENPERAVLAEPNPPAELAHSLRGLWPFQSALEQH